jgi:vitamin B12 transporter
LILSDVKQIEIFKGPASVQYGTDAIGGVIQLISKIPTENSIFTTVEAGERSTYKTILGVDVAEDGFYAQLRGQRFETDGIKLLPMMTVKQALIKKAIARKLV